MTEASENGYLVRVRAQVMGRDEATGGWVALFGGGLADVCVGKRNYRPINVLESPESSEMPATDDSPAASATPTSKASPTATATAAAKSSPPTTKSSPPSAKSSPPNGKSSPPTAKSSPPDAKSSPPSAKSSPPYAKSSPPTSKSSPPTAKSSPPTAKSSPPNAKSSPPTAKTSPPAAKTSPVATASTAAAATAMPGVLAPTHEYYIHGKRISDNMEVLECTIKKDFQYNKVMPTFHHWVTDEKRFGLTFQTAADARAFDKGVRIAVEELLDGLGGAWPSLHAYKQHNPAPKDDDEEQNIFECLNLPCSSRTSSENSSGSRACDTDQMPILCAIALPELRPDQSTNFDSPYEKVTIAETDLDRCSYVELTAVHDYAYPQVGPGGIISSEKSSPNTQPPHLSRESVAGLKKFGYRGPPPPLPHDKKPPDTIQARLKCRHCHEWYLESANRAGACEYAPDCFKSCIHTVSCMMSAKGLVYHCLGDSEGDFGMHPCTCMPRDDMCKKRWIGMSLLSLVVPCLCCYIPLTCVHRFAAKHELAGGLHAPFQ